MPTPTFSRHNRPLTPPISNVTTPSRSKHTLSMSAAQTSTSYSPTVTAGALAPKLNVVTRVAIEGRAKQGQDGASIKMYLKMTIPMDSIVAGMTIPLFQEENVKVLTSQVHPLDNNSVPYNFSSTLSPLLHNAARALNLPARSSETFDAALGLSGSLSSDVTSSSCDTAQAPPPLSSENIAPVDGQYTGHILVSGYQISYVLPKTVPSRNRSLPSETEGESTPQSLYKSRRLSIGERNTAQFMAAIDMWIPYVSRPPRSPYLLSIPTPRCLHNNIKLRIFPPMTTSSSFASLSSVDEEGGTWDLTSDPHVTRSTSSRTRRSNSYTHFADDESSDSSTNGFSGGCGIQGTFPSAERVRVRWAKPLKNVDIPGSGGDGRRRVGVQEVKGEMTCTVRGKSKLPEREGLEGVLMDVEYKGTCKGVWFSGVATMLGMDVGLEVKGSDVYWAEGSSGEWEIGGGKGFTGFEVGPSLRQGGLVARTGLLDSDPHHIRASSLPEGSLPSQATRTFSGSSTSSLLRAPLPENVAEYSFEGSVAQADSPPSPMGTVSSMSIPSISVDPTINPPGIPITLHLNMNDLVPPAKNMFTFTIQGTVVIVARPTKSRFNKQSLDSSSDSDPDPEPIVLPRFTVLAADSESTTTTVRNEITGYPVNLEVFNSTGDIHRDPHARKTVLQRGGFTKCTEDAARIALKSIGMLNGTSRSPQFLVGPHTPIVKAGSSLSSRPPFDRTPRPSHLQRDGPLIISSVMVTVLPLMRKGGSLIEAHAVRLRFDAPTGSDSEWLEFGLARPDEGESPKVTVTGAYVDGVPARYQATSSSSRAEQSNPALSFEKVDGKEWITWVRVNVRAGSGVDVTVDYLVDEIGAGKRRTNDGIESLSNILLPTFPIQVGKLEVVIDGPAETHMRCVHSNFTYEQSTSTGSKFRLLNFAASEFFYPKLSIGIGRPLAVTPNRSNVRTAALFFLTWVLLLFALLFAYRLGNQMEQIQRTLADSPSDVAVAPSQLDAATVTITKTIFDNSRLGTRPSDHESPTGAATVSFEQISLHRTASLTTVLPTELTQFDGPRIEWTSPPSVDTEATSSPPPLGTAEEAQELIPISDIIAMYWPIEDWDWQGTLEKVMETTDAVWQILRKLYHYPLDPP